jgi:polyhydroxyalkanoate synthesis regulator phasin
MSEPEDHSVRLLQELREEFRAFRQQANDNFSELRSTIDGLRNIVSGESVLGQYAAANVDERLEALEKRVSALEEGCG